MRLNAEQINQLDAAYLSILRHGLPFLRNLTLVWPERAVIEAEHLHEIPTFFGEDNCLIHIDYFRRMRRSYLEDLEKLEPVNPLLVQEAADHTSLYEPHWASIRAVLEVLPEWQSWRDYD